MEVLIGNIVAFVAASLMVYTGILNDRKKIIRIQILYTCLFIVSDFLLDGFSGAIINFLTIIRNLLSYYEEEREESVFYQDVLLFYRTQKESFLQIKKAYAEYRIYLFALTPLLLGTMFDINWYFTGYEK